MDNNAPIKEIWFDKEHIFMRDSQDHVRVCCEEQTEL